MGCTPTAPFAPMATKAVAVRLTDDQLTTLEALARARRVSRSALHRALLIAKLDEECTELANDPEAYARFAEALGR